MDPCEGEPLLLPTRMQWLVMQEPGTRPVQRGLPLRPQFVEVSSAESIHGSAPGATLGGRVVRVIGRHGSASGQLCRHPQRRESGFASLGYEDFNVPIQVVSTTTVQYRNLRRDRGQ